MFHFIVGDLRFGLRCLLKTRAASITVLIALSIGIGLSALMFSVIDGAIGSVLVVLLCAAWLGCLGPALRATRVDPQAALGAGGA
jgi:hypothetical protein